LLVANRTAADAPLLDAVRRRAREGNVRFHLVVPATPAGLHRVVDPEVAGREIAQERLEHALPILSQPRRNRTSRGLAFDPAAIPGFLIGPVPWAPDATPDPARHSR
jgi:hypothetical protein